ncbi:nitrilase-related carbon-nitrogen hydrolase [Actinospica sp.]|uniref:nitrilase-related carbon-nitrogen hydrolase n=1 Tax=Actinospica sp. TaxID=1872142 RepID=UPI002C21DB49|nr:nitrilase-related carbon-nitrogen hydrolase [Actinospica sp.]HWG25264.1 nitrilase-related carbon-nitrogen hydrolase [Actinospica sp.]
MTRIVCRQLAPTLADLPGNHRQILRVIAEETSSGADILILPELITSGYVFKSADEVDACAITPADPLAAEWAAAIEGESIVVLGYAERGDDGRFYNGAMLLNANGVLATYRKAHLWDEEKLFFTAGSEPPPVVATRFGWIAVMVCYDFEFPEFPRRVALEGADLIAVPTNWPLVYRPDGERPPEWHLAQAAARVNRVVIACCDRTGTERGQEWTEGTAIFDQFGWPASAAGDGHRAAYEVDLTATRDKSFNPNNDLFGDRRPELYL